MVKITNAHKGLTFKIIYIVIMVVIIAAIVVIFFMSQTGGLEEIAAQISKILSNVFSSP